MLKPPCGTYDDYPSRNDQATMMGCGADFKSVTAIRDKYPSILAIRERFSS